MEANCSLRDLQQIDPSSINISRRNIPRPPLTITTPVPRAVTAVRRAAETPPQSGIRPQSRCLPGRGCGDLAGMGMGTGMHE